MKSSTKTLPLGEVATFLSGGTPSKSRPEFWGGELPWFSAKDLKSPIVSNSIDRLTEAGFAEAKIAPKHSVLILVRGMTLFKDVPVSLVERDSAFNQDIKALVVHDGVDPFYLLHYLTSQKRRLLDLVDAAGHGTGRLDTDQLQLSPVRIPPLDSQKKIGAVIQNLDNLIARAILLLKAKEARVEWMRRKYLSGKRRFSGFNNGWKTLQLADVLTEHSERSSGNEEVYSVSVHEGLVNQIEHLGRSFAAATTDHYNLVKPGDIVYTKSPTGDFPLGIIKQSKVDKNVIVSPLYGVFTPKTRELGVLLDCYFESPANAINYLRPIVQRGAKNTISITNKTFLSNSLLLPTDPEEQKALAGFVELAKREIRLLEKQVEAYRRQKRGLMQKLLTGEWRVKS